MQRRVVRQRQVVACHQAFRRKAPDGQSPTDELPRPGWWRVLKRSLPWRSGPYSYTERKRIRKSFGKREAVLNVPYLLTMQKDSYVAFLQKDVPPKQRKPEGLQAAFCRRSRSCRATTGSSR